MRTNANPLAAATAVAAAFFMLASPAVAVDLPSPAHAKAYDSNAENVENRRRWRDHDDVDLGDILTGVLILGGIAAIAGAAEDAAERSRPVPEPDEDWRYRNPPDRSGYESRGLDRAVDICTAEIEQRRERVGSIDSVSRTDEGWRVWGELQQGAPFSCTIDGDGGVSDVRIGEEFEASQQAPATDAQWSDDDYARAREVKGVPAYSTAAEDL